MSEEAGPRCKFEPVQRDGVIDGYPRIAELSHWCEVFHQNGLTPEEGGASAGNLSFRTPRGFVITPSRCSAKTALQEQDFVEVVRLELLGGERFRVHFLGGGRPLEEGGRLPSSDSPMHHLVYAARPDVGAIFHGHDATILRHSEALGVATTPQETLFGTLSDAREAVHSLGQLDFVIRRGHGFVSVGRSMNIAARYALQVHGRAVALDQAAANTP